MWLGCKKMHSIHMVYNIFIIIRIYLETFRVMDAHISKKALKLTRVIRCHHGLMVQSEQRIMEASKKERTVA